MKIHLISDIHLEFGDLILPGGDTLIIAGDIGEIRSFHRNDSSWYRKLAANMRRFLDEELPKYDYVIYVAGNHEYYGSSIGKANKLIDLHLGSRGVHVLRDSKVIMDGIHIFGSTLWTSMNNDNPITKQYIRTAMNDFSMIEDFTVNTAVDTHENSVGNIMKFLEVCQEDKKIIVTHMAPSFLSVNKKYKDEFHMNGGFASDLSEIILSAKNLPYWFHGHMHDDVDYVLGETRVMAHPRGYFGHERQAIDYKPLEIEV